MRQLSKGRNVKLSGKNIRLNQLFKHRKRIFVLPLDHGVTIGPVQGLRDLPTLVEKVKDNVDAVVVHKGMVNQIADFIDSGLIVHLSASTALSPDPNRKEIVTSVYQSIKLGASAISVHINLGSSTEAEMLKDLGKTAELCEYWGMPLLAMMYVRDGTKESEYDPVKIKQAARVAEELGADIVKVNYTGTIESFSEVTDSVKIPVIIAGGPKMSSDEDLLKMISDSVKAGAKGVAIGRNVFQHEKPGLLSSQIRGILDSVT